MPASRRPSLGYGAETSRHRSHRPGVLRPAGMRRGHRSHISVPSRPMNAERCLAAQNGGYLRAGRRVTDTHRDRLLAVE